MLTIVKATVKKRSTADIPIHAPNGSALSSVRQSLVLATVTFSTTVECELKVLWSSDGLPDGTVSIAIVADGVQAAVVDMVIQLRNKQLT